MKEIVYKIIDKEKRGIKYDEILLSFSHQEFLEVNKSIKELEDDYEIIKEKNRYFSLRRLNMYKGELQISQSGVGFLLTNDEVLKDIFIYSEDLKNAMNKDICLVEVKPNKFSKTGLRVGKVLKVLQRGQEFYIGEISVHHKSKIIYLKEENFFIGVDDLSNRFVDGHIVKFKLSGNKLKPFDISIVGHKNDPDIDIKRIIAKYNVSTEFSNQLLQEIYNIEEEVTEIEPYRIDLTNEFIVTIDGEDAKDLDDAVLVRKLNDDLYNLKVCIADVSHYVKENSLVDKEAYKRGTSIYLVNKVIPMLPHQLSNGICSLNPNVLRNTITCDMIINKKGLVVDYSIYPSVIKSKHRLTYTYVNNILNDENYEQNELNNNIYLFNELAEILNNERNKRGAINFEINESKVLVNEKNQVIDVVLRTRDKGEKLIEEFMLKANETVCEAISRMNLPFIYRNHDKPNSEKLDRLFKILSNLGFEYKKHNINDGIYTKSLQSILNQVEGTPSEKIISSLMLKSMAKANYSNENIGHFGLASQFYTHFTSPIRRYPDLIVHRLLRTYLFNKSLDLKTINKYDNMLYEIGVSTSKSERTAIDLEREVEDIKKAEYVVKMTFPQKALISSVTSFGVFVELENTIEGLIPLSMLGRDYTFNEEYLLLMDNTTKLCLQLNDELIVDLERADKNNGKITFRLVEVCNPHKFNSR